VLDWLPGRGAAARGEDFTGGDPATSLTGLCCCCRGDDACIDRAVLLLAPPPLPAGRGAADLGVAADAVMTADVGVGAGIAARTGGFSAAGLALVGEPIGGAAAAGRGLVVGDDGGCDLAAAGGDCEPYGATRGGGGLAWSPPSPWSSSSSSEEPASPPPAILGAGA
jgi:hypothetical protein